MSDNKVNYNPFPLGQIPVELQRSELKLLKAMGYEWGDDREVVTMFEKKLADFWGSKYAVTTDSCTSAIKLSLMYLIYTKRLNVGTQITVPARTYVSAVQLLANMKLNYKIEDYEWRGFYTYGNTPVIDSAVYWQKDGYVKDSLMCLSMQQKKWICTGKMGAILCDHEDEYKLLKLMSYDGRDLTTAYTDENHIKMDWEFTTHCYAIPEDCARSIILMDARPESIGAYGGSQNYLDVRTQLPKNG